MDENPYLHTKYAPPPKPGKAPAPHPGDAPDEASEKASSKSTKVDPHEGYLVQDPEMRRMREEDLARDAALDPLSERGKHRLKMYVLGAVIFFPLATWFFTPAGFESFWFQLLVSVAYGAFLALKRPTGITCILVTVAAGLLIQAFTGHIQPSLGFLMAMIFYFVIGAIVGMGEMSRIMDGR